MVAFDHTGKTFAFAGADHIHTLANAEDINCEFVAGLESGIF